MLLALPALLTFLASALASFTEYLSFKHSVLKAAQFAFQRSMVFYLPEYPTHVAVLYSVREESISTSACH